MALFSAMDISSFLLDLIRSRQDYLENFKGQIFVPSVSVVLFIGEGKIFKAFLFPNSRTNCWAQNMSSKHVYEYYLYETRLIEPACTASEPLFRLLCSLILLFSTSSKLDWVTSKPNNYAELVHAANHCSTMHWPENTKWFLKVRLSKILQLQPWLSVQHALLVSIRESKLQEASALYETE